MNKPLVAVGDVVRIPKGYVGPVRFSYLDDDGSWKAVVGSATYRHEELEVVTRAHPEELLRPADPSDQNRGD